MLIQLLNYLSGVIFFFLHVTGTGSFPRALTGIEEKKYLKEMKEGSGEVSSKARRMLIEHNLRLVAHVIKKYYSSTGDSDDLVSIGTIGLIKAIDSFNPDRGIKLSSYASKCIENAMLTPMG